MNGGQDPARRTDQRRADTPDAGRNVPARQARPAQPINQARPRQLRQPRQPEKPAHLVRQAQPIRPTQSVRPGQPEKPAKPVIPTQPTTSAATAKTDLHNAKRTRNSNAKNGFSFRFLMMVICIIAVIMVTVYFVGAQFRPAQEETSVPETSKDADKVLSQETAGETESAAETAAPGDGPGIYIPIDYNIPGQELPEAADNSVIPAGAFGLSDKGIDADGRTVSTFLSRTPTTSEDDGLVFVTHEHDWIPRTCTEPEVCSICGAVGMPALGHDFGGATCKDPAVCERCGALGEKSDVHVWVKATCTEPKTCSVCGETEGEPLGHKWRDATCQEPKTCSRCGKQTGDIGEHDWLDATCTKPKTCSVCGKTKGEPLGHDWRAATCTRPKTCDRCGKESGEAPGHKWVDATSTSPAKCSVCGITKGSRLPNPIKVAPFSYTEEEYDLLARIMLHEAGSKSRDAMMAVGAVVLNRVRSSKFPNTVKAVLSQPGQFVANNLYAQEPPAACYAAARACLEGELYDSEVMYFKIARGSTDWSIRKYQFTVGDNYFYT